jgi:hypothetical protein
MVLVPLRYCFQVFELSPSGQKKNVGHTFPSGRQPAATVDFEDYDLSLVDNQHWLVLYVSIVRSRYTTENMSSVT